MQPAPVLRRTTVTLLLGVAVFLCALPRSQAQSVRVLSAGAAQGALVQLTAPFSASSGYKLDAAFDTAGALRQRVLAGEPADVVILSAEAMAALEASGRIDAASKVALGSVGVALAVRKGAPAPDITTAGALKATLLAAKSIAHADPARGATAGTHFAKVLERLGIADAVRPRVTIVGFGGEVVEGVAAGRYEVGVSQSSEIAAHPGVTLVARLPQPYAHDTMYVAAKSPGADPGADALLALLRSPTGRAAFAALGFAP